MSPLERGIKVDKLLPMSRKDLDRWQIMQAIKDKRMTQKKAAESLGITVRHVKRLYRAFRRRGAAGLVSGRRGQPSNNRLDPEVVKQALDLIGDNYRDFGPTLACEKLVEVHGLRISDETVRKLMIAQGFWQPKKARVESEHPRRDRRACFGELVQIDGSDHDWFEGRGPKCTLLVFIDDATGQLLELWFVTAETFFGYCEACRHYFVRYGKPQAFYSDRHGIFRVNQPRPRGTTSGMTQFGRAMNELGVQIVCANSPQAKGRIERANQTLQDRLVKELRLRGISTIDAANAYLPEYMQDFNRRFGVAPRSDYDAHRPLLKSENLDHILSHQETRVLSKNLTLQYNRVIYQIRSRGSGRALHQAKVTVCENAKGKVTILYQNRQLSYTIFQKPSRQAEVVTSKTLDRQLRVPYIPAPDHPWRQYGRRLNGKPVEEATRHGRDF